MLRKGLSQWRHVKTALEHNHSGSIRVYSEATSSGAGIKAPTTARPNPLGEEAVNSRLFEKATAVPLPEAGAGAGAGANGGAGAGAGEGQAAAATASKILRRAWNVIFSGGLAASAYFGYYTVRYTTDQVEDLIEATEKPENQFPGSSVWVNVMSWYAFQRAKLDKEWTKYAEPPSDRLLPDQHPSMRHVPTLVLDLDDLLIHSHWTRGRGWRTFKRPGADDFIQYLAQRFELVLYTHQNNMYTDPIMERLDPQHLISYRLYRESTRYIDGKHMRDLSKLNRDLSKVLILTTEPENCPQKENTVALKKWKLESDDTCLLDMIPFLEALASTRGSVDVRQVISSYEGQDIPTAFRERWKQAQSAKAQQRRKFGGFGGR